VLPRRPADGNLLAINEIGAEHAAFSDGGNGGSGSPQRRRQADWINTRPRPRLAGAPFGLRRGSCSYGRVWFGPRACTQRRF
jgi:hypothetical protein